MDLLELVFRPANLLKNMHIQIPTTSIVGLITLYLLLWLLQIEVTLRVLCSYCDRRYPTCSSRTVP